MHMKPLAVATRSGNHQTHNDMILSWFYTTQTIYYNNIIAILNIFPYAEYYNKIYCDLLTFLSNKIKFPDCSFHISLVSKSYFRFKKNK